MPQPPPDSKGYLLSCICPCLKKQLFLDILANFGHLLQRNSLEKLMFRKTADFGLWPNSAISGGRICPNLSKGTSTGQDHSYEPIPRSLRPSITKIQPGKESMTDGQTDRRKDGHPESIGPQPLGLGPNYPCNNRQFCRLLTVRSSCYSHSDLLQ